MKIVFYELTERNEVVPLGAGFERELPMPPELWTEIQFGIASVFQVIASRLVQQLGRCEFEGHITLKGLPVPPPEKKAESK